MKGCDLIAVENRNWDAMIYLESPVVIFRVN
jgi:hypothetical protein